MSFPGSTQLLQAGPGDEAIVELVTVYSYTKTVRQEVVWQTLVYLTLQGMAFTNTSPLVVPTRAKQVLTNIFPGSCVWERIYDYCIVVLKLPCCKTCLCINRSKAKFFCRLFSNSQPVLGTNPISVAAPATEGDSFVLDMATSTAALGKVRVKEVGW